MEREGDDFRRRVHDAYLEVAQLFPERIVVLDALRPMDELAAEVAHRLPLAAAAGR
jgi:dTMP kinase